MIKITAVIMKYLFALILVLFFSFSIQGQDSEFGNWMALVTNKKFSEKWNIHNSVQPRFYDLGTDLEQLLVRAGLGYDVAPKTNIMLGYDYIFSQKYLAGSETKEDSDEHRIFQQVTLGGSAGKLRVTHRYRFEERWLDAGFKFRMRYLLGMQYPIKTFPEQMNELYIATYNEIFINTRGTTFDRDWVFLGFGYKFPSKHRVEVGYMNHYFNGGGRDQLQVFFFLSW